MKSLLNDPEIHTMVQALGELIDSKAAAQGRECHTLAVIARGPEGNSLIIGGHECPGCLRAISASFEKIADGDRSVRESPAHAH